ncbi:MAG TPA: hypothetical protein DCG53_11890 [Syntrophus sp. (in: bacteria)]|nr:hypothetical protein [Syntrophus sp. (in: bacteria)]
MFRLTFVYAVIEYWIDLEISVIGPDLALIDTDQQHGFTAAFYGQIVGKIGNYCFQAVDICYSA